MRALLVGLLSQDSWFMAHLLHSKGYLVYGIIKEGTPHARTEEIKRAIPGLIVYAVDITNPELMHAVIKRIQPKEMYNFAGVSDVIDPFSKVGENFKVNSEAVAIMLQSIRIHSPHTRFFQSSSRLIYGNQEGILDEDSPKLPVIPYGAAKMHAHENVEAYRNHHNMYACSGIFFNHESERRPERFFTRKVSKAVAAMYLGVTDAITIGNLDAMRDFGYAKEYMEAAWLMLQQDEPKDYVIGTGQVISTGDYLNLALEMYGIQRECKVIIEDNNRGNEPVQIAGIKKIKNDLGWEYETGFPALIKIMIDHDISLLQKQQHAGTVLVR